MNYINKLPDTICQMENLESLHLGSNELRNLPEKFGNLANLKELWINDNYFAHFPRQITEIKTLTKLDCHGNQMKTMPKAIRNLSDISSLDMHKNKLTSIPRAVVSMLKSKLKHFVIHANRIAIYPHGFDKVWSKMNDTPPNRNDKKHKSTQKQAKGKSKKSASTMEATKVKGDNVVDAKATEEQAVVSVTESSQLHAAAPENMQLTTATSQSLSTLQVKQDGGAKGINVFIQVYLNGGNSIGQNFLKDKNTTDTKNPLKDLILRIADKACSDWKNIARQLDVNENEIKRIQGENPGQMKECCIEALNLWRKEKGLKDASVKALKKALDEAGHRDVVDEFDAANCGDQDVATGDSGQVEEETSIMEAAGCIGNVESDDRRHSLTEATTDQVQDPQATTQPKNAPSTLPKQPIEEGSRRCLCPNSNTSHQEKRAQKDASSSRADLQKPII
ncbi:uncharacterized protein LOC144877344 [Branchiostoma floridae x Branchiostoma japonicum]